MWKFLDYFPYPILIPVAVIMFLLPFQPMPHAIGKLMMLKNGMLNKPVDIFDLIFHTALLILLILKIIGELFRE
ncbi:hypothetical protein ACFL6B_04440 [Thermodesulfobacteriota bacterium]